MVLLDLNLVCVLFKLFESFEKVFGLKLNVIKIEVMWIGFFWNCEEELFGVKW